MKCVSAKLANMRKPQDFTIYPRSKGSPLMTVQSDKSIGMFNVDTGNGMLNTTGCYFPHLSKAMGAKPYQFPKEFVEKCLEVESSSKDLVSPLITLS